MDTCKRKHVTLKLYKETVINEVASYINSKISNKIKDQTTTFIIKHYFINETKTNLNSINKYFSNNNDESILVVPNVHESTFTQLLKQHIDDAFNRFNEVM